MWEATDLYLRIEVLAAKAFRTPEDISLFSTNRILKVIAHSEFANGFSSWNSRKNYFLAQLTPDSLK